jgi:hypothetical protein
VPELGTETVPELGTETVPELGTEEEPNEEPEGVAEVPDEPAADAAAEAAVDASSNGGAPVALPEAGVFVFDRVRRLSFRGDRHSLILEQLDVDEPGDRFVLGSVGSDGSVDLYEWLLDQPLTDDERREVDRTIRS